MSAPQVSAVSDASAKTPGPPPGRLMSLDVFRGATIAAMLLVNNPGSWGHIYDPLKHAAWHGWTFTDVIFPFFLWIVGMAIPLSFTRRIEQGEGRGKLFGRVVRRTLILFGLGLFLNGFPNYDWSTLRIPGVLQRIAICYFAAATIVLLVKVRGQALWAAGCLVVYWLLMKFVPVPGFGPGDLSKEGNFAHYIDSILLKGHMWSSSRTWDPEGVVSTLPAIATTLFGVLTGHLLRSKQGEADKTAWFFAGGCMLMFAGQVMNLAMPINKPLWTSSYAVFMAGLAAVTFATCYWIIDVKGWKKWSKPFAIYGMNAITAFVLAGLLARLTTLIKVTNAEGKEVALKTMLWEGIFVPLAREPGAICSMKTASVLYALIYITLIFGVCYVMYRKKWFVRL